MSIKDYILKHTITHVCDEGVTCSGGHEEGLLEFPSTVFLEATLLAKEQMPNKDFPPD